MSSKTQSVRLSENPNKQPSSSQSVTPPNEAKQKTFSPPRESVIIGRPSIATRPSQFGQNGLNFQRKPAQQAPRISKLPPQRISSRPQTALQSRIGAPSVRVSQTSQIFPTGNSRFTQERFVGERIVGVHQHALEARVVSHQIPELRTHVNQVETFEDEPVIKENIIEKPVEVIREQKVRVERFVDVPYDVIVERPIEKIIEKEIDIERVVEVPVERTVEVPVERIVDVPVERIVHKPVEIERRVNVPYERIVERRVEQPIENIVYHDNYVECDVEDLHLYPDAEYLPTEVIMHEQERIVERPVYVDNIIERVVDVPIERIIQVPVERIVEQPIEHVIEKPVYIDNIIEREVQVPVEKVVERPVEHIVERPVYIDNIIERPVPIEVIREETVEVPVEHIVERPVYIDNIIEKPVEVLIENPVPVERVIEVPIPVNVETHIPVDVVEADGYDIIRDVPIQIDTITKLPIEYHITTENPVPVESVIEVDMPVFNTQVHEIVIDRPVEWERTVQRAVPVEKIVEVEVERVTENPIYTETVIEVPVVHDRVIEQKYDVIIENHVEVPVEKVITVPIRTISQNPVEHRNYFEKDINVVSTVVEPVEGLTSEQHIAVNDPLLHERIIENANRIAQIAAENSALARERAELTVDHTPAFNHLQSQNAHLRAQLSELESRLNIVDQDKARLEQSLASRTIQHINYTIPAPDIAPLSAQLQGLLNENHGLVHQAAAQGELNNRIGEPQPVGVLRASPARVLPARAGGIVSQGPIVRSSVAGPWRSSVVHRGTIRRSQDGRELIAE